LGLKASTKIILAALEANEAKGRRKCIRAFCTDDTYATMNYKGPDGMFYGKLLDISSAGIAVNFDHPIIVPGNSLLRDIQLKLRFALIMTDGVMMGNLSAKPQTGVIIFGPKMGLDNKLAIHHYIKQRLQYYIDHLEV
jgi:hypothetical protein